MSRSGYCSRQPVEAMAASRITWRVQLGGRSVFLNKLYPEQVSTAIVWGLKAFSPVTTEPRTLYIFDVIRQKTPLTTLGATLLS